MEIRYQIFEQEQIIIQQFIGYFSHENFKKYSSFIMSVPESRTIRKVLIDIRKIEFRENIDTFNETVMKMVSARKSISQQDLRNLKMNHVFWVKTPLQTAAAQLFVDNFPQLSYSYFVTENNIVSTLSIPKKLSDLEDIIKKLENTFSDKQQIRQNNPL